MLKEHLCRFLSCNLLLTRHQNTHFVETVNHNINIINICLDIGRPPTKSMEMIFQGREGTESGVYKPNFLFLDLLVAHKEHPLTYLETLSFILGQ